MNTPKKVHATDAEIRALAEASGVDPARITLFSSPEDPALRDYTSLTDVNLRRVQEPAEGMFIAESTKIIERALATGYSPRSFLMNRKWFTKIVSLLAGTEAPIYIGDDEVVESVTGYHLHRGALAAMERNPLPTLAEALDGARRVVVVEDIVDHTNLGAIFRSAAALDVDAVLLTPHSADPLYRRSIRVSMGAVFSVPWTRFESWPGGIAQLRELGFHTAALALDDSAVSLQEFAANAPEKVAVIMGTEGDGLKARTVAAADSTVMIPMSHGIDSLNVAAATAVTCYALMG